MRTEVSTRLTQLRIIQLQLRRHTRSIARTTLRAPVTTRTATGPALLPIFAYAVRVCTPCLFPSPKHILSALDCHAFGVARVDMFPNSLASLTTVLQLHVLQYGTISAPTGLQ